MNISEPRLASCRSALEVAAEYDGRSINCLIGFEVLRSLSRRTFGYSEPINSSNAIRSFHDLRPQMERRILQLLEKQIDLVNLSVQLEK